jgi:hypothetical protein
MRTIIITLFQQDAVNDKFLKDIGSIAMGVANESISLNQFFTALFKRSLSSSYITVISAS